MKLGFLSSRGSGDAVPSLPIASRIPTPGRYLKTWPGWDLTRERSDIGNKSPHHANIQRSRAGGASEGVLDSTGRQYFKEKQFLSCANAAEKLNGREETDFWMCQQEVIDDLDKRSFNGVTETKAWLQWLRGWGDTWEEGNRAAAEEAIASRESLF